MDVHRGRSGGRSESSCSFTLFRLVVVLGLATLIALAFLVRPLPESPVATATPTSETPYGLGTVEATGGEAVGAVGATPTAAPTRVVSPTSTPTPRPTPPPEPTATPSPTPTPTDLPLPTWTPTVAAPSPASAPAVTDTAWLESYTLAGRVEQGAYPSRVTARQEPYRIYLPPGYDQQDRRYPVLYLLHGWPYDESHWDVLGVDETADARIVGGSLNPFLMVLPGADSGGLYVTTSGGPGSFEEQLVNELMPHIDATYRTVQTREARAIGGISRGGVWALEIAFRHPDAFAIVGAHSPALSANRAPSVYDPFVLLREPGVEGLRIYLSAGDADWARQATANLQAALEREGLESRLAIHNGAHRDELWREHLGDYLAFYAAGW